VTPGGVRRRALTPDEGGPQILAALLLAGALGTGTVLAAVGSAGPAFAPPGEAAARAFGGGKPRTALVRHGAKPTPAAVLDLNAADARALAALPGIGPALAERIVADRAARGPFATPEDLRRVPGVGASRLARIRPSIRAATRP
jgi:competence protein ComEA